MLIPSHNTLCTRIPERAETSIPRRQLRSYKERPHHLCKVMRAFLPRAQGRSYLECEGIHGMPIVRGIERDCESLRGPQRQTLLDLLDLLDLLALPASPTYQPHLPAPPPYQPYYPLLREEKCPVPLGGVLGSEAEALGTTGLDLVLGGESSADHFACECPPSHLGIDDDLLVATIGLYG